MFSIDDDDAPAAPNPAPASRRPARRPAGPPADPVITEMIMQGQRGRRSLFNGFKPMSPQVRDAIEQTDRLFPANDYGVLNPGNQAERFVVFHDRGQGRLVPGPVSIGTENSVNTSPDLGAPTARIAIHSHPYVGRHSYYEPSMNDQIVARLYPHIEHIVQTPSLRGEEKQYFTFSGATPQRFYRLLPNPDNLPVPPKSPDRGMPAFRERPVTGVPEGIPFSELPGNP